MENIYTNTQRVEMLKRRAKRCCCRFCGGRLEIRKIIFSHYEEARIEIFCSECNRIEYGTEKEIYLCAKYFVEELGFNCYADADENELTQKMTIAKVCDIMAWENKILGILDDDGFQENINFAPEVVGETLTLSEKDLAKLEQLDLG